MNDLNRFGRTRSGNEGFTLIELLVVVLIIGILAAIAIPQYFKVVERSRLSEGQSFIASVKSSEERYLARAGAYASSLSQLDITFGSSQNSNANYGLNYFNVTYPAPAACSNGSPGFTISLTRVGQDAGGHGANAPTAYANGAYIMQFDTCSGNITYPNCTTNCVTDFGQ